MIISRVHRGYTQLYTQIQPMEIYKFCGLTVRTTKGGWCWVDTEDK